MRVYLGSDHAGFELKMHLVNHLIKQGHDVVDVGPHVYDPEDDYPSFCLHTGAQVVADPGSLGIVIGGLRQRRADRRQQDRRRPCRAGLAGRDRPAGPPAQRRQRDQHRRPRAHPGRGHRLRRGVPGHAVLRQPAARPPDRPARRVRKHPRASGPAREHNGSAGAPRAASSCGARSPGRCRRRRSCSSVGRAASRARSAAPTLTWDEPEPTRPRRPRSISRSSPPGPGGSRRP